MPAFKFLSSIDEWGGVKKVCLNYTIALQGVLLQMNCLPERIPVYSKDTLYVRLAQKHDLQNDWSVGLPLRSFRV
jgi:hypothetical protein